MRDHLKALADLSPNFDDPPERMTADLGWIIDGSHAEIGNEPEGPPRSGGLFDRVRLALIHYDFSDPRIVVGHFDPEDPFLGRNMLLELKVLGLRYLGGVRVTDVREEVEHDTTHFGFRYDTLAGHIERGFEWFLLSKDHATGSIHFRIEAHWKPGKFPNWWSRVGFLTLGEHYRHRWRCQAADRLRRLANQPPTKHVADPGKLAHRGDTEPQRTAPGPD
ncbi:hypothetical protein BH23PLA1_BH23PLA1_04210 [soil metagenome]